MDVPSLDRAGINDGEDSPKSGSASSTTDCSLVEAADPALTNCDKAETSGNNTTTGVDASVAALRSAPAEPENGGPPQRGKSETLHLLQMEEEGTVTYDDVLTSLGEWGRFQLVTCLLLCLPHVSTCVQVLLSVFTLAVPDHRCAVAGLVNDTWQVESPHHLALINGTIPPSDSAGAAHSSCRLYDNDTAGLDAGAAREPGPGQGVRACHTYVYDRSQYTATIATDLDLVCERSLYRSHAQMMIMLGQLVGCQVVGICSDLWGRKMVILASSFLHVTSALVLAWVQNYVMLMVLMLVMGFSVAGLFSACFVMIIELVGPSKRRYPTYAMMAFWSCGMIVLGPLAYCFRHWRHLQLVSCLLPLPVLTYWWLIPESPRWLLSKGRVEEAKVIIERAARINHVTIPPGLLDRIDLGAQLHDLKRGPSPDLPLWRALCVPSLLLRHLIVFFAWFVLSLTYYGLSWSLGTLQGSIYLNLALAGLVELAAFTLCLLLLDRLGRRALCGGLLLGAGLACTATLFPTLYAADAHQWSRVVLAMVGKLGVAGAFATIYIFSSELFPTVVRHSSLGASSLFARLGGIVAPYAASAGEAAGGQVVVVPLVIFGLASVAAGTLLFFLPETRGRRLPETVEDALDLGRKKQPRSTNIYHDEKGEI